MDDKNTNKLLATTVQIKTQPFPLQCLTPPATSPLATWTATSSTWAAPSPAWTLTKTSRTFRRKIKFCRKWGQFWMEMWNSKFLFNASLYFSEEDSLSLMCSKYFLREKMAVWMTFKGGEPLCLLNPPKEWTSGYDMNQNMVKLNIVSTLITQLSGLPFVPGLWDVHVSAGLLQQRWTHQCPQSQIGGFRPQCQDLLKDV